MGLFSKKVKQTVLEAIGIDLSIYPNDTFTQEQEVTASGKNIINHYLYLEYELLLNLFPQLNVITFPDSSAKNYIFRCPIFEEFKKSSLIELVNNIYDVYGSDDSGYSKFSSDDWQQIKDGFWTGRAWTSEKYSPGCSFFFDAEEGEGDGLTFTIWTS